ncbi:peptidoglycan-binding domain-containing protein [Actinomadura pelletieri]|uniref:peptidoglycan-binding domain-containing protein n=1 Tax=Actinomadura pelletieri TaxID=111805 RepID=UPI0011C41D7B|nr:peptidoglycan-binding domain-containing protein [Actinomadura pelletieri]
MLWITGGATVLSIGGVAASGWVRSPAEVAANTDPPTATVITAPVVYKVLRNSVVVRGTFETAQTTSFTPSSVLSPDGRSSGSPILVVSRVLKKLAQKARAGSVIAEVSYRPVFVLHGQVPAVRDLSQGMSGRDVSQLQSALAEVGFSTAGDEPGVFSGATASAVKRFYAKIGYPVPLATGFAGGQESGRPPAGTPEGNVPAAMDKETADNGRKTVAKVMVPMSEVMYVPTFPSVITSIPTQVGGKIPDPLVTLNSRRLRLTAKLDQEQAHSVRPGQRVHVYSEMTGISLDALVGPVGQIVTPRRSGSTESAGGSRAEEEAITPYRPVQIISKQAWPAKLDGENVRVTVTAASTEGPVLAVPQSALSTAADGLTVVTVQEKNGSQRRVAVEAGMSAEGLVEVRPRKGELAEGQQVVIGK